MQETLKVNRLQRMIYDLKIFTFHCICDIIYAKKYGGAICRTLLSYFLDFCYHFSIFCEAG